ncbi:MAG: glycosyltransferase [Candidatus Moranbacteria bacterium]|nr:glycosyltransferase [Candidatus Moranbacteria bacterium]
MKIAIFTNNYLPNPFGVSGSIESFRKVFEKKGHTAYIFAPYWKGYTDSNPNVFRYPALKFSSKGIKYPLPLPYSKKMNGIIKKMEFDIIHAQHPNLLGAAGAHWAKKKNVPLVFTWHTLYDQYAHFVPLVPRKMAAAWAIGNARKYANRADQVIVPTPSVGEIIKNWGVTNENIEAVPTGVEEDQFSNLDKEIIREKYGIKKDEILLFVMTRLTEEKNVLFLFDAAVGILEKNPKTKFMICGDGGLKKEIAKKIDGLGLRERIILAGIVSSDEKKNYYAAGDIFVYASKSETQGMILTEAMYSGLPIVAVRTTGVKDVVEDGRTGFLTEEDREEFSEAAQKLIDDAELRRNFGEEAARTAREKYTATVCGERMLGVYERVINKK